MKDIDTYKNKSVLVLGLGKSGVAAANLLIKLGAKITVNDAKKYDNNPDIAELESQGARVLTGMHSIDLFNENFDFMFKNPGIPYTNVMVKEAQKRNIPVLTEPELAYEVLDGKMIAVTGTNGKTTTTTLISLMLQKQNSVHRVYTGGNIGIPLSQGAQVAEKEDYLVSELSSFQLMGVKDLHPKIAVLTNIYSTHLDYHGSRENYIKAKMNITKNQTNEDFFVVNYDNKEWIDLSKESHAQVIPFTKNNEYKDGAYVLDNIIYFKDEKIIDVSEIRIPGSHNVENAMAAICVAKTLDISTDNIKSVLKTFGGVKHRIQFVDEIKDRLFYNDSKATNIKATTVAINAFNKPINLIAGGLDRGNGFEELIPSLSHVKNMVVYGQTADKLANAAQKANVNVKKVNNLNEAVVESFKLSRKNEIILLSPACASWDQFDSFEQRGDVFINEVEKLKKETK
ncbi:UDP-N-acetylmuramoyl-L-alanine--D-glutamate ligase [Companilactobacillus sp. DQM5]|uniref:UDP-N-acetylmuramoyl-L-alanine--D-glutamate ligase n=1 Tax=Companilactobacillus sp. DQM5 TaxID=3463359 RepID=UPI0040585419